MLERLKRYLLIKLQNIILRAVVTDFRGSIGTDYPTVQVKIMGRTGEMESLYPYGITGVPPLDSIGTVMSIGANTADRSGILYHPQTRDKGLKEEGEVVLGNLFGGTYLKFTALGTIEVWRENTLIIADLITHTHNIIIPDPNKPVTTPLDPTGGPVSPPTP